MERWLDFPLVQCVNPREMDERPTDRQEPVPAAMPQRNEASQSVTTVSVYLLI